MVQKSAINVTEPELDNVVVSDTSIAQDSSRLLSDSNENSTLLVPPTTPASNLSFGYTFSQIPRQFPKLDEFAIPYIREIGIKSCLERLADYFGCKDYKLNPIQFWFLDVIVDCLWRMQDEFQFPEQYQKIAIEWILYVFDLIRAPQVNLSRRKFFEIVTEATTIAEDYVRTECDLLPFPNDLFNLTTTEEDEKLVSNPSSWFSARSSNVSLTTSEDFSILAIVLGEDQQFFDLPKRCWMSKGFVTPSEDLNNTKSGISDNCEIVEDASLGSSEEDIGFYKPNLDIPSRFLSSSSEEDWNLEDEATVDSFASGFTWKSSSGNLENAKSFCPSKLFQIEDVPLLDSQTKDLSENINPKLSDKKSKQSNQALLKRKSLSSSSTKVKREVQKFENYEGPRSEDVKAEWLKYIEERKDIIKEGQKNIFINCCVLFAIKKFIMDYFHDSYQFLLIKLALMGTHSTITQSLNSKWNIPKVIKDELKVPKLKKEMKKKKEKKKKTKPKKKSKKDAKSKKGKGKEGKLKNAKKPKKKKLTKAEKAEVARLRKEQMRLDEERRLAELSKRLLFPLNDAANDDFYKNIFENWVKPKTQETTKKGKKGNKGKK